MDNTSERFRLDKAFRAYVEDRTEEGFDLFLDEFAACIRENRHTLVPAEYISGALQHGMYRGPGGWYYGIFSAPEEAELCPELVTLVALLSDMTARAAKDEEIRGICVNPGNRNCVYIPKKYLV